MNTALDVAVNYLLLHPAVVLGVCFGVTLLCWLAKELIEEP